MVLCVKAEIAPGRGARKTKPPPKASLFKFFTSGEEEKEKEQDGVTYSEDEDDMANEVFWPEEGEGCSKWWTDREDKDREDKDREDKEGEEAENEEMAGEWMDDDTEDNAETAGKDRAALQFSATDHPWLVKFRNHLTSRHGKSRSVSAAMQYSADVVFEICEP